MANGYPLKNIWGDIMNIQPVIKPIINCFNEKVFQVKHLYAINKDPILVFFNDQQTKDLGACIPSGKNTYIYVNPKVVKKSPNLLNEIVAHELAHFVCQEKGMVEESHGERWKYICQELGGTPQEKSFEERLREVFAPKTYYMWESLDCFELLDENEHHFVVSLANNRPKWLRGYSGKKYIL